ncbi:MAG: DUF445 family protein [Planctomycetes bacterium]|nr:DUF445 family protein [Planctomycetota bacterium]MBT6784133.1 DUF445 family protein [Planctomycetota bacterium]MBT7640605.1 DUF445 family protein [Planctomycetota bacterium]
MQPWLPWIVFPLVGALIGWATNWLAVKMLFRPHQPIGIGPLRFQGVVPRRHQALAESIAETVQEELISAEDIAQLVQKLATSDQIRDRLKGRIDVLIEEQLQSFGPMVAAFLPNDLVDKIRSRVEQEVFSFVEELGTDLHGTLGQQFDLKQKVRDRILAFELDQMERLVLRVAKKELRHIELLGGVLGFIVGLVEAGLLSLWSG